MQSEGRKTKLKSVLCKNIFAKEKKGCFFALSVYLIFMVLALAVSYFVFAAICAFMLARELYETVKLCRSSLYLTYDLVKTAKGRRRGGRRSPKQEYVFDFGEGGKYIIAETIGTIKLSLSPDDEKDPDKVALTYFEECEEFYLLVAEYKGKKKILQIFSLREYELSPKGFEEKDGRYFIANKSEEQE